jgi:8-oxo-dGTP pyrophosphatase MutT (NUDIX family)
MPNATTPARPGPASWRAVPTTDPLLDALDRFVPTDARESADVERIRTAAAAGDPWDRAAALHVTGSALIVHPPTRRVLLRWHTRQQAWLQVGGHGDPGERDPLAVARREGEEETGLGDLVPFPDDRIVHVVVVQVPAAAHEGAHEHADVRFLLATADPDAARPERPDAALRWLTVAEAVTLTEEANVRDLVHRAAVRM